MQSRHKSSSGQYFDKTSIFPFKPQTKTSNRIKKNPAPGTQTDNFPDFGGLFPFNVMPLNEINQHYQSALRFLNGCHGFINSVFMGEVEHLKVVKRFRFKVPEVPDYFSVLEVALEDDVAVQACQQDDIAPKRSEKENSVCDLRQFLPDDVAEKTPARESEGRAICSSRLAKSEETLKSSRRSDMRALSSTFQDISRTCNEFENKSLEYLCKNDDPLNEPLSSPIHLDKTLEQSLGSQGGSADKGLCGGEEHQMVKSFKHPPDSAFNLLEYALRTCRTISRNSSSHSLTEDFNRQQISSDVCVDLQGLTGKMRSLAILNQAPQCQSPKRVNELFERISRECLRTVKESEKSSEGTKGQAEIDACESMVFANKECHRGQFRRSASWRKEVRQPWMSQEGKKERDPEGNGGSKIWCDAEANRIKCDLLKLIESENSKANPQALQLVGFLTDNEPNRSGVVLLEEKRRLNLTRNKCENMQFSAERKFNFEAQFNDENVEITRQSTSAESLGSEDGISVSMASTVSESDLFSVKSNDELAINTPHN